MKLYSLMAKPSENVLIFVAQQLVRSSEVARQKGREPGSNLKSDQMRIPTLNIPQNSILLTIGTPPPPLKGYPKFSETHETLNPKLGFGRSTLTVTTSRPTNKSTR